MGNHENNNLQGVFVDNLLKNKTPTTVFLINGVKLQGIITKYDHETILLRRDGQVQLIYKHAVSTIMPNAPVIGIDDGEYQEANNA